MTRLTVVSSGAAVVTVASAEAVDLLKEMFDHNAGQVVVGGKRSQPFHIESGVLQGSVLSPCLYSIFLDDLAYELSNLAKVQVGSALINCTMYADDIAFIRNWSWGPYKISLANVKSTPAPTDTNSVLPNVK